MAKENATVTTVSIFTLYICLLFLQTSSPINPLIHVLVLHQGVRYLQIKTLYSGYQRNCLAGCCVGIQKNSTNWCQEWDNRMATRAASKLEEQMAALLEKMDRQSEQLEDLVHQRTKRMDGLAQKQEETKEFVSAVENNLNSVKAAVSRRLDAVEGALTCLRTELQEELLEKQEHLRKELCHELLQDLSTPTGLPEGGLRPTAPPFVPRTELEGDTAVPATRGPFTTGVTQPRPSPFDGKCTWDTYRAQFELLADLNKWSDADKAAHLAINLRVAAATVLANLPPLQQRSYEAHTAALNAHFRMVH